MNLSPCLPWYQGYLNVAVVKVVLLQKIKEDGPFLLFSGTFVRKKNILKGNCKNHIQPNKMMCMPWFFSLLDKLGIQGEFCTVWKFKNFSASQILREIIIHLFYYRKLDLRNVMCVCPVKRKVINLTRFAICIRKVVI